jgi:alpha-ketoglutarate-dependent taurine dioxygenase
VLKTLDFDAGATPEQIGDEVLAVWPSAKVVHIRGPKPQGDFREFYWSFFNRVGEPLPIAEDAGIEDRNAQRTGGYWFEVRYEPGSVDAYRHSANAQPLHTDMSYIPIPNSVGFLGCVAMPEHGGATTFVDSIDIVEALRNENPDLLARLEQTVLPHARSGDRRVEKVIRYTEDGQPLLNWNYYCVDSTLGAEAQALREGFFEFLKTSPAIAARTRRVKLSPGDAVMWKDEHVLHGRDSFDADKPSERFLWKSGLLVAA